MALPGTLLALPLTLALIRSPSTVMLSLACASPLSSHLVPCSFEATNQSNYPDDSSIALEKCRCTSAMREIVCEGLNGVIPSFRFSDEVEGYQRLCLSQQGITQLPDRAFASVRVATIVLNFNSLSNGIAPTAFRGLEKVLQELQLGGCKIGALPGLLLSGMDELRRLHLWGNSIATIPAGFFKGAKHLRELFLWDNDIHQLNDTTLAGLWSLRRLDLDRNRISSLPKLAFRNLIELEVLHLRQNSIRVLYEGSFEYANSLKVLSLDGNLINIVMPRAFDRLDGLLSLSLADNSIDFLSENQFANLRNLSRLVLRNNKIGFLLPKTFLGLRSLQYLDLSGNSFVKLPDGILRQATRLRHLILDVTNLTSFRRCALSKRAKLKTLSLVGANITCDCQTSSAVNDVIAKTSDKGVSWGTCAYAVTSSMTSYSLATLNETVALMTPVAKATKFTNFQQHLVTCTDNQTVHDCHANYI